MTQNEFVEKLSRIVDASDKMILIVNDHINVEAPMFTYSDMQKFIYLLQRTSCEWYIYPSVSIVNGVRLKVRTFE